MTKRKQVIELIIAGIVGLGIGIGGTIGIQHANKPKEEPPKQDLTAEKQQDVVKQLTNLDLIFPVCSTEKIENSLYESIDQSLLCRYLACLQFSRGVDSKTGGSECEHISNIMNKKAVIEICKKEEDPESRKACVDLFDRRL